MARSRYAQIVLFLFLAGFAAAQTPQSPQAGVLVLRNGQVLEGEVIRAGDYYVVTKGEGSELRIKADEAECFCASLAEAYDLKAERLSGLGAKPHLGLAEWCLRQGLYSKCSEQLIAAMRAEPNHPRIKELETRLAFAVETPPPTPVAAIPAGGVSASDLDKRLNSLPRGSVEKFGAIVQPILLNRCGANRCHGPNAESEFRLLRPPPGQTVSRRFTQRNLYATLNYIDQDNPDSSPLLLMPQQRHGGSLAPVFDKHTEQQLAELVAWTRMTIAPPPAAQSSAPPTITLTGDTLSQPAGSPAAPEESAAEADPPAAIDAAHGAASTNVRAMRPAFSHAPGHAVPAKQPPIRDRYDPEIFNRHYHGK
jgi:hypothetical protein